jgi:hypothetical protein
VHHEKTKIVDCKDDDRTGIPTETSALQVARVHGYIGALEPAFEAQCRRILGALVKLALPAR